MIVDVLPRGERRYANFEIPGTVAILETLIPWFDAFYVLYLFGGSTLSTFYICDQVGWAPSAPKNLLLGI